MKRKPKDNVILVVDDDDMNLQVAKMILEKKLPCKVIGVDNGKEGIEILRHQKIRLVLLDILMPDFDGIETLQEIRADEHFEDLPVMMLTASGDMENVKRAAELGVTDYIKKPFMPAKLIERVGKKLAELESQDLEKVLVIDDDKKNLETFQTVLEENFPYEVVTTTSNSNVTEMLYDTDFDLVIVSTEIKFLNGFKILNAISQDEELAQIPVVLTSIDNLLEMVDKIQLAQEDDKAAEVEAEPVVESKVIEPENHKPMLADTKKVAETVTLIVGENVDIQV